MFADFRIDYSSIDRTFLANLDASSFSKIGLVLRVWTNDPSMVPKPVEFKLSESAFDLFERFREGERVVRAIRKIIGHCKANDHDMIVIREFLGFAMSRNSVMQVLMEKIS